MLEFHGYFVLGAAPVVGLGLPARRQNISAVRDCKCGGARVSRAPVCSLMPQKVPTQKRARLPMVLIGQQSPPSHPRLPQRHFPNAGTGDDGKELPMGKFGQPSQERKGFFFGWCHRARCPTMPTSAEQSGDTNSQRLRNCIRWEQQAQRRAAALSIAVIVKCHFCRLSGFTLGHIIPSRPSQLAPEIQVEGERSLCRT